MTQRGLDFLGNHFSRDRVRLAVQTVQHFVHGFTGFTSKKRTAPEGAVTLAK